MKRFGRQITSYFRSADALRRETGFLPKHGRQLAIALFFCIAAVLMFPRRESFQFAELREGDIYVGEEIIAPFTFSVNKTPEEYDLDVKEARTRVSPVFVRSDSATQLQLGALDDFFAAIEPILKSVAPDSVKKTYLREQFVKHKMMASSEVLLSLVQIPMRGAQGTAFRDFRGQVQRIAKDVFFIGILSIAKSNLIRPNAPPRIAVRYNTDEMLSDLENFYDLESVDDAVLLKLRDALAGNERLVKIGYEILTPLLRPNLFYDAAETQHRAALAANQVPLARGTVLEKERIIESNEKITREHIQKLRSLAEEKIAREGRDEGLREILPYLGKFMIAVLAIGFLSVFIWYARPRVYEDISQVFLIAIILLLVIGAAFFLRQVKASEYLIPITLGSLLLTVFFDYQLAFAGTASLALLLGGMTGNQFSMSFITIVVGAMSIAAVSRVRSRSWIFKAILFIFVGYVVAVCAIGFIRYSPVSEMAVAWLYGGINALLCPVLSYGLMVILEYVFDVTTDATLLELSDLNRPLLREFAMQAPGSYHHSILVGTLSEAAAESIGANSLLARVGAYYHDIGKMDKPEYFVENQKGGKNPHEKLTPNMSYLIIINHVKRGLEIAEENRLPKDIRDFIPQHHGTNLITYFYKKALERMEDTEVHESDFRYPGPKPQTKETGIVMLADSVEAAARSLRDPSVSRLRSIVNAIVEERFKKGELDECPLTLRDLNLIKESFERTLNGVFHGRVKYKEDEPATATRSTRQSRDQSSSPLSSEPSAPAVLP